MLTTGLTFPSATSARRFTPPPIPGPFPRQSRAERESGISRASRGSLPAAHGEIGWTFRRQHVVAGYIVDFYCAELRLAVEVDGLVHDTRGSEDQRRDAALEALGLRVIRFPDAEVNEQLEVVLDSLRAQVSRLHGRGDAPR
jgi:Protein of unknown function (DUF559)